MKTLIAGLLILICGILLTQRLHSSKHRAKHQHPGVAHRKKPVGPAHFFYPFMIPVGLIIATAGAGLLWSNSGKKKRRYDGARRGRSAGF